MTTPKRIAPPVFCQHQQLKRNGSEQQPVECMIFLFKCHRYRQQGSRTEQDGYGHHPGQQLHDAFYARSGLDEKHAGPGQRKDKPPADIRRFQVICPQVFI